MTHIEKLACILIKLGYGRTLFDQILRTHEADPEGEKISLKTRREVTKFCEAFVGKEEGPAATPPPLDPDKTELDLIKHLLGRVKFDFDPLLGAVTPNTKAENEALLAKLKKKLVPMKAGEELAVRSRREVITANRTLESLTSHTKYMVKFGCWPASDWDRAMKKRDEAAGTTLVEEFKDTVTFSDGRTYVLGEELVSKKGTTLPNAVQFEVVTPMPLSEAPVKPKEEVYFNSEAPQKFELEVMLRQVYEVHSTMGGQRNVHIVFDKESLAQTFSTFRDPEAVTSFGPFEIKKANNMKAVKVGSEWYLLGRQIFTALPNHLEKRLKASALAKLTSEEKVALGLPEK